VVKETLLDIQKNVKEYKMKIKKIELNKENISMYKSQTVSVDIRRRVIVGSGYEYIAIASDADSD